jgi:hypothetical protein
VGPRKGRNQLGAHNQSNRRWRTKLDQRGKGRKQNGVKVRLTAFLLSRQGDKRPKENPLRIRILVWM